MDPEWIGAGLAVIGGLFAAAWKFAGLKADISEKWGNRVGIAQAGLSEQARLCLRSLQRDIGNSVGEGDGFDPLLVIADPAGLKDEVGRFLKLLRIRESVNQRYRWLLNLGPFLLASTVPVALGAAVKSIEFGRAVTTLPNWTSTAGYIFLAAGLGILILCFAAYAYLQNYLSKAEIMSRGSNDR